MSGVGKWIRNIEFSKTLAYNQVVFDWLCLIHICIPATSKNPKRKSLTGLHRSISEASSASTRYAFESIVQNIQCGMSKWHVSVKTTCLWYPGHPIQAKISYSGGLAIIFLKEICKLKILTIEHSWISFGLLPFQTR